MPISRQLSFPAALATTLLMVAGAIMLMASAANAHNITKILAKHPEFSTFNHYLTVTHLAPEINRRETITVFALDNAAMGDLITKHLSVATIKNVLSLHVCLDYFGAKKLHQIAKGTALCATMYQATGEADGSSGFVNITDLKGGKVAFGAEDNDGILDSAFVKSLAEIPYNISVIQVSHVITSPEAMAPIAAPTEQNLTSVLAKQGCKVFADTLSAVPSALTTFQSSVGGGLTVFCPGDEAMKDFMPKYHNLTADGKASVLLYHGVPVYMNMAILKSNNGLLNTLATDGAKKFDYTVQNDGEDVTLITKIVKAKITGTVIDVDPLVVYTLDKVLLPKELFKALSPAPAPAPEEAADSPKPSKKKKKKAPASANAEADASPADSPSEDDSTPADEDNSAGEQLSAGGLLMGLTLALGLWILS